MNGTRRFATNHLNNSWMRVTQSIDGNTAEEVEILSPGRVIYIAALTPFQHKRLSLVGRQQEFFRLFHARIALRSERLHSPMPRKARTWRSSRFFGNVAHHAADSAVCAEFRGSRVTSVPGAAGTPATLETSSCPWVSPDRDANNKASGPVPPTMRTSRTPPSIARLAASSFKTIPPETTRHCTNRSISSQLIAESTLSPSSTPATSVR